MIRLIIRDCSILEDPLNNPKLMEDLPENRRSKVSRYKKVSDRKRSLMAGILIKDMLQSYGLCDTDITLSDNGRLLLSEESGLDFNISHSGDMVVMAISDEGFVGCDVEHMTRRGFGAVKKKLSDIEIAWIDSFSDDREGFYRVWTARESYTKLTGEGITLSLDTYEVRPLEGNRGDDKSLRCVIYRDDVKTDYIVRQYMYNDYIISICTEDRGEDITDGFEP